MLTQDKHKNCTRMRPEDYELLGVDAEIKQIECAYTLSQPGECRVSSRAHPPHSVNSIYIFSTHVMTELRFSPKYRSDSSDPPPLASSYRKTKPQMLQSHALPLSRKYRRVWQPSDVPLSCDTSESLKHVPMIDLFAETSYRCIRWYT